MPTHGTSAGDPVADTRSEKEGNHYEEGFPFP